MKKYFIVEDLTVNFNLEEKYFMTTDENIIKSLKRHESIYEVCYTTQSLELANAKLEMLTTYTDNCYCVVCQHGKEYDDFFVQHYKDMEEISKKCNLYSIIQKGVTEELGHKYASECYNY